VAKPRKDGRTTGSYGGSGSGGQRGAAQSARADSGAGSSGRPARRVAQRASSRPARRNSAAPRLSAAWLWLGVIGIIVVVGAVVVIGQTRSNASASVGGSAAPIVADTTGTYDVLVARANGLYDQGAQALQKKDFTGASRQFAAAASVYRAAWKQQPGAPAVGTDFATSLYYSGDVAGALKQVDAVLAKSPTFQNALMNKGIFLQSQLQTAQQNGQTEKAAQLRAQAKAAFQKAVQIDPSSTAGQQAAKSLSAL
jgi:hypothetical protein